MTFKPDVPGRGAWSRRGGLLAATPGSNSVRGYYRLAVGSETPIGSLVVKHALTADTYTSVWAGVRAVQALSNDVTSVDIDVDGWYGPDTDVAVHAVQKKLGVIVDGVVGRDTMKALLTKRVKTTADAYAVPFTILGGMLANESALDPAAVGVNGYDHGLVQINLAAHPEVSWLEAMTPAFAITFAATSLASVYKKWRGHTTADPWDIAIAYHNNPSLAIEWADTGKPPYVSGRTVQIETYVKRTRTAW